MVREQYNIYCDESCYLENDKINIMGLGAVWCKKEDLYQISLDIKNIKNKYKIKSMAEVKWSYISKINFKMYFELINYFFNNEKINYRGYFVFKNQLDHQKYDQTHDDFYYKCYYGLLQNIFNSFYSYNVYIDVKDKNTNNKAKKLLKICQNSNHDYSHEIINNIQQIQSYESQLIQIADIITGAICYCNRTDTKILTNKSKKEIVELIKKRTDMSLNKKTYPSEKKFNLFFLGDYSIYE